MSETTPEQLAAELAVAAERFLDLDNRARHVIEGWWTAEDHHDARARLEKALAAFVGDP